MTTLDYQRVYTIMMWYEYRIVEVYFCIYTVDLIRLSSYRGVPMATVRCWDTVAVVTGGMVVMNLAVTGWLVGHKKMYWLVVDLPLYMEIYGSVYSQYIENTIYVLQWIGFVGKIYWFKPHISWENLWFPVQIFPTKPIQKDVLFNPDWGDDLKKDSLKYSHQFQASATGSGFIYKYDIYIYIIYIYHFLNKNLKLVSTPMGASRYSHHCLTTSTATSEACTTGNFESDPQINRPKQCLCQARGQGLTESGARGFSRSFAIQWLGGSDLELPRVSQAHTSSVGQWETSKQSWIWSGDGDPDDISLFFSEKKRWVPKTPAIYNDFPTMVAMGIAQLILCFWW